MQQYSVRNRAHHFCWQIWQPTHLQCWTNYQQKRLCGEKCSFYFKVWLPNWPLTLYSAHKELYARLACCGIWCIYLPISFPITASLFSTQPCDLPIVWRDRMGSCRTDTPTDTPTTKPSPQILCVFAVFATIVSVNPSTWPGSTRQALG